MTEGDDSIAGAWPVKDVRQVTSWPFTNLNCVLDRVRVNYRALDAGSICRVDSLPRRFPVLPGKGLQKGRSLEYQSPRSDHDDPVLFIEVFERLSLPSHPVLIFPEV